MLLSQLHSNSVYSVFRLIFHLLEHTFSLEDSVIRHLHNATKFNAYLTNNVITHKQTVTTIAKELSLTRHTLLRVCNSIFARTSQYILDYRLLSKCMLMLLLGRDTPIANVANDLQFQDIPTFNRYVKNLALLTPSEIRQTYKHIQ